MHIAQIQQSDDCLLMQPEKAVGAVVFVPIRRAQGICSSSAQHKAGRQSRLLSMHQHQQTYYTMKHCLHTRQTDRAAGRQCEQADLQQGLPSLSGRHCRMVGGAVG